MNIPSNPSTSLSFPCGDPGTVQNALAIAGTAVTTAVSTPVVVTLASAIAIAGVCYAGYKLVQEIKEGGW